jgi:transposase
MRMRTSQKTPETITTIEIDLGKNTFHLVGLHKRGAIVLQQKVSRGQLGRRLANIPRCLIGMEACLVSHHIGRQLAAVGHNVRLIPGAIREAVPQRAPRRCRCRSLRLDARGPHHLAPFVGFVRDDLPKCLG